MRRSPPAAVSVLSAFLVGIVAVESRAEAPADAPDWSVSFGLGGALLGGTENASGADRTPVTALSLLLERRLGGRIWLLARGEAGRSSRSGKLESPPPDTLTFSPITSRTENAATFGGGSVGLRFVFNPGDRVELSAFGIGGLGYAVEANQSTQLHPPQVGVQGVPVVQNRDLTDRTLLVGANAGLAFETAFTQNLSLRLSSSVVSATWSRTGREEVLTGADGGPTQPPQAVRIEAFDGGVDFRPSLELRLRF